jgi:hypothetical protein
LDRNEAINLFKEIHDKIPELTPQAVTLIEAKPHDPLSTYTLHLKGLCTECKEKVIKIVDENGLAVKEQENELTIYTP